MNILLVLIPVTLLVIAIAVALFFWAVNHQQFDDLDSPAILPLMDDPPPEFGLSGEPDSGALPPPDCASKRWKMSSNQRNKSIVKARDPDQG